MADQLVTTAQVKARLQSSAGGVTFTAADDTLISELIDQVSDWIQHYTGRKLVPVNSADYYLDTQAGYVLRVPQGVRAVTFLGVATTHQPDTGGTYTTISAANILLRPSIGDLPVGWPATEIRLSRAQTTVFGTLENGAKVTMTCGFAAVPPDIQAVALDAVVAAFQNRKSGASGVIGAEGYAVFPWSQYFSKGSPQRMTVERYRYPGIA
jgi:hypothetical protein